MTKKGRYRLLIAVVLVGIIISYHALVVFIGYKAYSSAINGDRDKAVSEAQALSYLTAWSSFLPLPSWYPLPACHYLSEMVLAGESLAASVQRFYSTAVGTEEQDFEKTWSDITLQFTTFQNAAVRFGAEVEDLPYKNYLFSKLPAQTQSTYGLLHTFLDNQEEVRSWLDVMPQLMGSQSKKRYTVLLQNNRELRPTGGFLGSYLQLDITHGKILTKRVEDIYVPDGAIIGHVEPPQPLQDAFKQGEWRLRDSNWDPDFYRAAQTIDWFFKKGGVDVGDGIIAINLEVAEDFFDILGEVYVPDYGQVITKDNLYAITQHETESEFFPGSTQKRDILQSITTHLFLASEQVDSQTLVKIAEATIRHLEAKNIQIYLKDPVTQELIRNHHWSGEIRWPKDETAVNDYFAMNEANVGANKANCCISRQVIRDITASESQIMTKTDITIENHNLFPNPEPPKFYGGNYKNYIRFMYPGKATDFQILVNGKPVEPERILTRVLDEKGLQESGTYVLIPHKESVAITVLYTLPRQSHEQIYKLFVQKQSGVEPYALTLSTASSNPDKKGIYLEKDTVLELPL